MTNIPDVQQVAAGKAVAMLANGGTYGGFGGVFAGLFTSQHAIAWAGVLIGVVGLILSYWHKRAMQRIERERLDWDKSRAG